MNCRFQQKTRDFLQKRHVFVKYVSRNPKYHVSCVLLCKINSLIFQNLPKMHVNVSYSLSDLHFLARTCHANPTGTIILQVFRYTNLRFFTNFTLRTHLKRQHCVSITFWVWNRSGIVSFNQKRAISSKITCFCKICVKYHVSCVLLFKIRTLIFRNLAKTHVNASYSP